MKTGSIASKLPAIVHVLWDLRSRLVPGRILVQYWSRQCREGKKNIYKVQAGSR